MATLTVRILGNLNQKLDQLAEETGILKSSLILYALNDRLRTPVPMDELSLFSVKGMEPVRITLRLPDALKERLEEVAKENDISVNFLVNYYVQMVQQIYWAWYKKLAKQPTKSTEKPVSP